MMSWLFAFVWTLAFETPVYAALLEREARSWRGPLLVSFALNAMTHPLFSWWVLSCWPSEQSIVLVECAIFVAEGLALAAVRARNPRCALRGRRLLRSSLGIALLANLTSYGLGRLFFS